LITLSILRLAGQQNSVPDRIYKNQIELRHDNDFPVFTDRYYTTGNFIGWRTVLPRGKDTTDRMQYSLFLIQELYTPADIIETDIKKFDRPFAGFLGISNGITLANSRRLIDFQLVLGITGNYSGGAWLQELFHSAPAVSSRIPTWLGQIRAAVYGNVYAKYTREWQWQPNPFSVHFAFSPQVSFGNRDIYAQQEAAFFFGRRNPLQTTSAYQQLGSIENEYFFAVRLAYRYIFQNALLEGDLLGDSSLFLIKPHRNMFLYKFDMNARLKRHNLKITYHYATRETRRTYPHLYLTFSIARTF
jgi:hypothetical protein